MREVLGLHKSLFEESVVKAFTKRMSIYPVGSLVRLDNGAVAKVIASNPASPLRPIILIFLDPRGNSLFQPQTLDLARDDSICIKEPLAPQGVTAQ
jgi:hypothetical protein